MKCRIAVLSHVLDAMDSQHVLARLLNQVTPEENIVNNLSEEGQRQAINVLLQNIEAFQETLDEFRAGVISWDQESPADEEEYQRLLKQIKTAMAHEIDETGHFTGRVVDRELIPDTN